MYSQPTVSLSAFVMVVRYEVILHANYLKPLQHKKYMLSDTLKFPESLKKLPAKGLDEVDISYDV